jgi:hypothetical protein
MLLDMFCKDSVMNQISTSYLPPPYCFFFLEGFREKIPENVCSARDFRFAKSGILREFCGNFSRGRILENPDPQRKSRKIPDVLNL